MLATPAGFTAALAESHSVQTRVEVLEGGVVVDAFTADSDAGVVDGKVTVDANAAHRRMLTAQLADPTGAIIPEAIGDLLTPPNEVRVWQGIVGFPLLPVFTGAITAPSTTDDGGGSTLALECADRSRTISKRSWVEPYVITRGQNVATVIAAILADRAPEFPALNAALTTATTATEVLGEDDDSDPWADATAVARDAGLELYFSPEGVPTLRPIPDPLTDPLAATYAEGAGGLLVSGSRGFSDEPGYNGVVVVSEGSDLAEAFRVAVWDTNPSSPTYYDPALPGASRWGPRPKFIRSERILTAGQALVTAQAELRLLLGTHEDVRFSGVPNPAHEAGDVLALTRGRIKLDGRYVLDVLELPLGPGVMTGTCRSRTVA